MRFRKLDEKDVPINVIIILDTLQSIKWKQKHHAWLKKSMMDRNDLTWIDRDWIDALKDRLHRKEIRAAKASIREGNRATWRQLLEQDERKEAQS